MDLRKSKTTVENEWKKTERWARKPQPKRLEMQSISQASYEWNGRKLVEMNWATSNDERDRGRAHMSIWPYLILNEIMSTFCHRKCYLLQNKCNRGSILLAPNRIGSIVAHYKWRCKNFASNITEAVIRQRKMRSQCIKCNEYLEVKWNELNFVQRRREVRLNGVEWSVCVWAVWLLCDCLNEILHSWLLLLMSLFAAVDSVHFLNSAHVIAMAQTTKTQAHVHLSFAIFCGF